MIFRKLGLLAIVIAGMALAVPQVGAAPNPSPVPGRLPVRTNSITGARPPGPGSPKVVPPGGARTNALAGSQTNSAAGGQSTLAKWESSFMDTVRRLQTNPSFYPAVGISVLLVVLLLIKLFKSGGGEKGRAAGTGGKAGSRVAVRKAATKPIHSCNVLEVGAEARQVWQFDARGGGYVLNREQTVLVGETLPKSMVAKDWRSLFQPRLNIAWLPPEHVFLRVAQLPKSDFDETLSMVELQMEKLSPIPVTQAVWSFHTLPHVEDNLQTVIVMVVARSIVEEFLGKLEAQGYLADRLELPLLDQLQTTAITEDGAWIYP
ncbi:MAG TPA: hypothetical protein VHI52_19825, partial [Verrucomicrobiae bacterium]|nr:hypothetical protein [Verrucomicrobiae bacterium]